MLKDNKYINVKLTFDQEDDLFMFFTEYIKNLDIDYFECLNHFEYMSDTLVSFILLLEKEFDWFDYTQADDILCELNFYIKNLNE